MLSRMSSTYIFALNNCNQVVKENIKLYGKKGGIILHMHPFKYMGGYHSQESFLGQILAMKGYLTHLRVW